MPFDACFDTGLHADCVQFVPDVESSIAVFSCYELMENEGKRHGRLILAEFTKDNVKVLDSVDGLPGVFEFSWFPGGQHLITALAEGLPKLFKYDTEQRCLKEVTLLMSEDTFVDITMTLAVSGRPESFLTSDHNGVLRHWTLNSSLELNATWTGHEGEIWHVSQDTWNANLFLSASDDASMKIWDMRNARREDCVQKTGKNGHGAGVCCARSSPWDEHQLATSSYDEKVRFWDRRNLKAATREIECKSGVWRFVWNPKERSLMAAAAMRAGFHVINLNYGSDDCSPIVRTESVDDHVAYGIDWHANGKNLATCSFYNNQGQFFRYEGK